MDVGKGLGQQDHMRSAGISAGGRGMQTAQQEQ